MGEVSRTIAVICSLLVLSVCPVRADVAVAIGYLRQEIPHPPVLSNLDPVPQDRGLAGATLGLKDNAATGTFLGHSYTLEPTSVPVGGDLLAAARSALSKTRLLLVDAPADDLLRIADLPEAQGAILFNVSASQTRLRSDDCRANLFHTVPSDAMRTDALMQFLVQKRWTKLAMIAGPHAGDAELAGAMRNSAAKFGIRKLAEKTWNFDADMRRSAAREVPVFTQDLGEHDVLLVVDTRDDYGRYIPYNAWLSRPIAGTEGIVPVAWSPVVEQWGAAQLQSRFSDTAGRPMRPRDYAAWAAVRALGEAVTRTGANTPEALRVYMLSEAFELAGFKGRSMSFRTWNGQLRQPIPLVTTRAMVAQAPLEGFLHQRNEMDSLGLDKPESHCTAYED